MERTEFEALVARMEAAAAADPVSYRRRVIAWAALGYGYLAAVIAALVTLVVLLGLAITVLKVLGVKLIAVAALLLWAVLRSLYVRFSPPEGLPLARVRSPELFEMLDRLQRRMHTVRIHDVLVTGELNAAVVQMPRFGLFGPSRNVLLLGLPLLKTLTREQFESVLAHELGHLSRGHARTGNWIYRLRLIWSRLEAALSQDGPWGSGVIRSFFRWYIPRFSAISFPLARANEYEADAAAVSATSPRIAAQALTGVHVYASYLDQNFWPSFHERAKELPDPGTLEPHTSLVAQAVHLVPKEQSDRWWNLALAAQTTAADTHPSLSDRLRAMGSPAEFAPPGEGEDAALLLGDAREDLEGVLDEQWRRAIEPSWREYHGRVKAALARRDVLREKQANAALSLEEWLEFVAIEEAHGGGPTMALAEIVRVREAHPDSADALFVHGRLLLEAGEESGIAMLDEAGNRNPVDRRSSAQFIARYLLERGRREEAQRWLALIDTEGDIHQAAQLERAQVVSGDPLLPHGLDETTLATLRDKLRTVDRVRRAWIVRKAVVHFPEMPLYVLGFSCTPWFSWASQSRIDATLRRLIDEVRLPGEGFFVCVDGNGKAFRRRFRRMEGSRLL